MVLLHGGMTTAETFDAQAAGLSRHYRVYVPERRGHGRTPDVPGPLTFDIMAEDNAAFLRALDLAPAHLVGWSDGAAVGLLTALVMMGDDDIPSIEHANDIHKRLADSQLAIVAGTSHALPMEKPDLVNRLTLESSLILRRPRCFSWDRRWSLNERLPASAARGP